MGAIEEIRESVRLAEGGQVAEARERLQSMWQDVAVRSDSLVECVLAHHLADLQEDPREELRWDLVALGAGDGVTEKRAAEEGVSGGRLGLFPSLHLNLVEDYLELDDPAAAREHLRAAGRHLHVLADNAYGQRIRAGFARLETRLGDETPDQAQT